jgi:LPXTG-motif cell wall anchor domain protein
VKPSEDVKPSSDIKSNQEAPKEDKKSPSSEVKQEKVAPKQEEKQLPNTSVDSLVGVLGAGFVALLGGLGLKIKKDHTK